MSSPSVKWSRLSRGSRGTGWCRARNGKQQRQRSRAVCRKCSRVGRERERAEAGMLKPSPWQRSLYRSSAEAGRNWGEGVIVSGRAGPATSPEESARAAGETRRWRPRDVGGGEERSRSGKGAGRALPPHACASRSSHPPAGSGGSPPPRARPRRCARWQRRGWPALPAPPGPARPAGVPRGDRRTPVSSVGGCREPGTETPAVPVPSPTKSGVGGLGRATEESAPGFPAHFNSVSASSARRFTPPGAPEPAAGTRCTTPSHSPSPGDGKWPRRPPGPQVPAAGPPSLSLHGSDPGRPWRLERGLPRRPRGGTT